MYSLQFPANSADFSEDLLQLANREDLSLGLDENFQRLLTEETSRYVLSGFLMYKLVTRYAFNSYVANFTPTETNYRIHVVVA